MSNELENILIAKQINPTAMRLLVLEYLLKQKTAIGLSDLEKEIWKVRKNHFVQNH